MNNYQNYQNFQQYPNLEYYKKLIANNQPATTNLFDPYTGFIHGNMFPELYDPYKLPKPYDIQPLNEQARLLTQIDALTFAVIDLGLYLDVNPEDHNMLNLFNQYRVQLNNLKREYEAKYGPLTLNSDALTAFPWAWNNHPWPWENR